MAFPTEFTENSTALVCEPGPWLAIHCPVAKTFCRLLQEAASSCLTALIGCWKEIGKKGEPIPYHRDAQTFDVHLDYSRFHFQMGGDEEDASCRIATRRCSIPESNSVHFMGTRQLILLYMVGV